MALDHFRDGLPDKYRGLNAPGDTLGAQGLNVVPVTDGPTPFTKVVFGDAGKTLLRGMPRSRRLKALNYGCCTDVRLAS